MSLYQRECPTPYSLLISSARNSLRYDALLHIQQQPLFEFLPSQMPKCHNSRSKLLLHDQCNSAQGNSVQLTQFNAYKPWNKKCIPRKFYTRLKSPLQYEDLYHIPTIWFFSFWLKIIFLWMYFVSLTDKKRQESWTNVKRVQRKKVGGRGEDRDQV